MVDPSASSSMCISSAIWSSEFLGLRCEEERSCCLDELQQSRFTQNTKETSATKRLRTPNPTTERNVTKTNYTTPVLMARRGYPCPPPPPLSGEDISEGGFEVDCKLESKLIADSAMLDKRCRSRQERVQPG